MRLAFLSTLLVPLALAQSSSSAAADPSSTGAAVNGSDYLTQVLQALTAANLTSLVGVASAIANTTEGQALLGQLAVGNKTVFAPNNEAFSNVSSEVSSNTTLLTQILSYHILNNTYTVNGTQVAPNHTIARSLLLGGGYTLPGNRSAPLVLSRNASDAQSFEINQATTNVSTAGPAAAANLLVYIIPSVLELPPSLADAAGALLPSLAGLVQQAGLLDPLTSSPGITVFAPSDAAVSAVAQQVQQLNSTVVSGILANHVINGSVVYSTGLTSSNYTSAGGQPFTFTSNSSGTYVTSANSTARIIQSDVIVQNGVVHVIDGVLLNTGSNPDAAASAYSSGTAAAATMTEPTTPVTATSNPATTGSGGGGGGGSSSASPTSGAFTLVSFSGASLVGLGVGALGAVIGGGMVFF